MSSGSLDYNNANKSPSSRRAWIEIYAGCYRAAGSQVALLAEGVDRNICTRSEYFYDKVALLAEGVDRNIQHHTAILTPLGRPPRGGRG